MIRTNLKPIQIESQEQFEDYLDKISEVKTETAAHGVVYKFRRLKQGQTGALCRCVGKIELLVQPAFEIFSRWGCGNYQLIVRERESKTQLLPTARFEIGEWPSLVLANMFENELIAQSSLDRAIEALSDISRNNSDDSSLSGILEEVREERKAISSAYTNRIDLDKPEKGFRRAKNRFLKDAVEKERNAIRRLLQIYRYDYGKKDDFAEKLFSALKFLDYVADIHAEEYQMATLGEFYNQPPENL